MRATGFSGYAMIMGKERRIVFDEGVFTIEGVALDEAQELTAALERNSAAMAKARAASTLAEGGRVPIPPSGPAPVRTRAPAAEPAAPPKKPEPTPPEEEFDEVESESADDDEPDPTDAEEREAIQAVEREAEEKAKAEEARKAEVDAKKRAAKERAEKEAAAAREAAAAEKAAAEKKAAEKKGNTQAPVRGEVDVPDEEERPAPKATSNGKALPEAVKNAKHLRAVIAYLIDEQGMSIKEPKPIIAWCMKHADQIEVISRIGDRLTDRVERALEVMAAN